VKKTRREKSKDKPSLPKVLRLENGFSCGNAVREIRPAWQLSVYTRTLSYLRKR
jgi:hypothetical protein